MQRRLQNDYATTDDHKNNDSKQRIKMKTLIITALALLMSVAGQAQTADTLRHEVMLETTKGNIRIALYNETPRHRDNFIKLVREGFYDGLLFHRVIDRFMIQTGDSAS